jgi:hypothetical protein
VNDFPALKWMVPPRHGAPPVSLAVTALVRLTVYEATRHVGEFDKPPTRQSCCIKKSFSET